MPAEEYVKFIRYKGIPILLIDFADCQPAEVLERMHYARARIGEQPLASVRTLTILSKMRFNNQVSEAFKSYTTHNKPYVLMAAVVGLSGLQEILFNVVIKVTGRKIATFPTVEAAKEFLANPSL